MARANKIAILLLKVSVSATLLYFLISKIGTRAIIENISLSSPGAFVGAIAIYLIASVFSTLRWQLLIPTRIKARRLFGMYMIGSFFNTYLPGLVGGDGVKAYYLSRDLKAVSMAAGTLSARDEVTRSHFVNRVLAQENMFSIASVFMDRYIGMSALLCIGLAVFPLSINYLGKTAVSRAAAWIIPLMCLTFILVTIVILKLKASNRLKFLANAYEYFQLYRRQKGVLLQTFLYSLVVQMLSILAVYILSKGMALDLSFLSFVIFVPIITLVSFVPVSISGLGLREGAFVVLLGAVGIPADVSMTLSILWFLSVVVASMYGLFEYLGFKTGKVEA